MDRLLYCLEPWGQAVWSYGGTGVILLTEEGASMHWDANIRASTTSWANGRWELVLWDMKREILPSFCLTEPDKESLSYYKGSLPAGHFFHITLFSTHWGGKCPSLGAIHMASGVFLSVILDKLTLVPTVCKQVCRHWDKKTQELTALLTVNDTFSYSFKQT